MLDLRRIGFTELHPANVDLSAVGDEVVHELREDRPDRDIIVEIAPGLIDR